MLNKANRLKKRKEFNYIYKKGQMAHSANFTVHYVRAFKPYAQIGISVSKTVGNSVVRSRVKRIISEACRLNIDKFAIKNYIITAKPSIADKKSTEIETELLTLLNKNGLIKTANQTQNVETKIKKQTAEKPAEKQAVNKKVKTQNVETSKPTQKLKATNELKNLKTTKLKADNKNVETNGNKQKTDKNVEKQNVKAKNVESLKPTAKKIAGKGKNV